MTHASLFSGIGGPEVAAAMMGWDNVFHCEINPFGRSILDYWFPESESYEDITKTDFSKYRGRIDVLTGGFPCQPFSYAGKRGGQADDRYLWPEMLRVIDQIRPTWVVGENVAGITTMVESCETIDMGGEASLFEEDGRVHRFRSEYTFTIERICRDLESKGYSVQPMLIPACAVGAPHRRDRVFIIAHAISGGSESYKENRGTESIRSRKFPQPGKWGEPSKLDNGLSSVSRFTHNTDSRDDLREAGEDARKSRKERISEWNEVRELGESSDVRSETEGTSSDSHCNRRNEVHKHLQSEITDGAESIGNGGKWDATHTESQQGERCGADEGIGGEGQEQSGRVGGESIARMLPGERWKGFPSVSPVHRRNDGLPFDVDNLTISFAKWRNESLKAYGNAIVPQVMYRIFQCIEETEKSWR